MISVVIPTFNDVGRLGPCFGGLAPAVMDPILTEVILVDAGSSDGIEHAADETGAKLIKGPTDRAARLRLGAEAARADWLLLLSPEARLGEGWVAAAHAFIGAGADRSGRFDVRFEGHGLSRRLAQSALAIGAQAAGRDGGYGRLVARKAFLAGEQIRSRPVGARLFIDPTRHQSGGWVRETLRDLRRGV